MSAESADGRIPSARRGGADVEADTFTAFAFRSIVPGCVATILIAVGAFGVGWLPINTALLEIPVVDAMRSTTLGAVICKGAIVIGVALLFQAWLLLGHDVMKGSIRDIRRLWITLVAWSVPLVLAPPLFSRDVYSYFAQGKLMVAGIDPYTHGSSSVPGWFNDGVDPLWAETPTPYGQFFLLLSRGVAQFAGPHPYTAALAFRVLALVGVALMAWGVPKLAGAGGINPIKALWLGVLNPLVLMHFVSGAHNDALMIGLIVSGLVLAVEHRALLGSACIALASSVKPIGLLALPFVGLIWAGPASSWSKRWQRWIIVGAVAVAILIGLTLVTGTGFGWVRALSTPGAVRTWLSPPTAIAMAIGAVLNWFGLDITDTLVTICRLIGTLVGLVVVGWLVLKPEGRTPIRGCALALLALVVLGPVVQPWYMLWCLALFAASGLSRIELRITLLLITGFTLHGLVTSSATQDSLVHVSDGLAVLGVAAVMGIVLAVSPRERKLMLGESEDFGLQPEDAPSSARYRLLTMRRPGSELPSAPKPNSD